MKPELQQLDWNPSRVLFGLSRIGYTPHSALADIADNSVTNGADNVWLYINKIRDELSSTRKNNIKEYVIVDDGDGMDREGILSALSLGSDDLSYSTDSLSKFGLGLKSASFSQGKILEVVSSKGDGFVKYSVNLNNIDNVYFCQLEELSKEDESLINEHLSNGIGTIVRITDIHHNNHPSLKSTEDALKYRLGTIYYYFLSEGLNIFLNGEKIEPYDVLFTDEADANGNLDENEWSGRTVNWIKKPTSQTLDISGEEPVSATVEVTQLPHPPIHALDGEGEQKRVRDKYKIGSGNYGFYVYRNKRLISWAERFDGIIPQDQDFYSFRGRILLDSDADDAFNIDVKKSHLELSDEAHASLSDLSDEYKRKSKKAWQNANSIKKQMMGNEPNNISNDIAEMLDLPDLLPGEELPSPEKEIRKKHREEEIKRDIQDKIKKEAKDAALAEGKDSEAITDEEVKVYADGGGNNKDKRILRVPQIEDNLLWEPYYDDDHGWSVRINKTHRFARCIFEDNSENIDMQVIFELLLLNAAQAEIHVRRNPDIDKNDAEHIVELFRESVSNNLAQLIRKKDIKLPPL